MGSEADPSTLDLDCGLGVGKLLDDLPILESDDIDAASCLVLPFVTLLDGRPVEAPPGQGFLLGFVCEGVLHREAESAVVPEPGGPDPPEVLLPPHPGSCPVLE